MSFPLVDDGRIVSCELVMEVVAPAEIVLQVEVSAGSGWRRSETLRVESQGRLVSTSALAGEHGGRLRVFVAPPGRLAISYRAETTAAQAHTPDLLSSPLDRVRYLRPSRYCPSDHLIGFAVAEFGIGGPARSRVEAVTAWIRERVGYLPGSSSVHDSAEDTLLTGAGTCRDFAHLGVALCRALGVPARFASVYAPGLSPMDFHAVFEAWLDGGWHAQDATGLAPRASMVRIATGRDAADTAFASVLSGIATLISIDVSAIVTGRLPSDDGGSSVQLP